MIQIKIETEAETGFKWAAVFPGQGSQSVGMLADFADEPVMQYACQLASDQLGYDVWQLMSEGPEARLNQTEFTQPALLTADVVMWEYLREKNLPAPVVLAGHSLGEFSALVCTGAMIFVDAIQLVAERGRLMQAAVPMGEGGMGAILGLDNVDIEAICHEVADVEPANFNSIGQTVVAGKKASVQAALKLAIERGAKKAVLLPMSVPSHCQLMQPAADRLKDYLANIILYPPAIPVLHNYDVKPHADPHAIREVLVRQLTSPVRWVETIQAIADAGVEVIVEIGPGKVLQGLNKRINKNIEYFSTNTQEAVQSVIERMKDYVN
ncbi:MAG: [acyl-carrier-protein] S-malonyltransferase [Coxiella sp. RIFCSPHIGHO2_12_FULL_44_14]|nr:MAG: [acyl-carrier-protein] S-malonyltransferase [Coxiella sp. RIFCSPHIGHO2_12_FULL_44_14]